MCGRYNLRATPKELQEFFDLVRKEAFVSPVRNNIKPTTKILVVRREEDGQRHMSSMRWGLVPTWAPEITSSTSFINARSDSVAEKRSFKNAFKKQRCLIPASGYYEWPEANKKSKVKVPPYSIHRADNELMAFAGIWETWTRGTSPLQSCAIITTDPNSYLAQVHSRMPVVLTRDQWDIWLDPDVDPQALQTLLIPYPGDEIVMEVSDPLIDDPVE